MFVHIFIIIITVFNKQIRLSPDPQIPSNYPLSVSFPISKYQSFGIFTLEDIIVSALQIIVWFKRA